MKKPNFDLKKFSLENLTEEFKPVASVKNQLENRQKTNENSTFLHFRPIKMTF